MIKSINLIFLISFLLDEYDFGTMDATTTADAGPVPGPVIYTKKTDSDRIPTWSDMCIVQSTIQGKILLISINFDSYILIQL